MPLMALNPAEFEIIWEPPHSNWQPGDVVVGQRIAGRNTAWLEMCAEPGLTAIYDLDDNLMEVDPANAVIHGIYAPMAQDTADNIAAANVVTVSTQKLADRIRPLNPNVHVLPNCLHASWLLAPLPATGRSFTVGWAGSMFHGQDFGGVAEALQRFHAHRPNTQWHSIGASYLGGVPHRTSPFQPMASYLTALDFSVGIAPLTDTPFNQMKSHIKVLEYAGRAIPAVASNVGQYPEFIEHGVNGFLIDSPSELFDYLELLVDDERRTAMSAAAYATAQEYSIRNQIHLWENVYREA